MNWFKENPVIVAIAAVGVLGTGVGCYFAIDGAMRHDQAVSDYTSAVQNVRRLEGKQPFPNAANLQKVQSSVAAYKKSIEDFGAALNKMEVPLEDVTPQKFQDNLRLAADNLAKAAANKTKLPANFFFGFDDYRAQLPPQNETKELNREFQAIKTLVEAFVSVGITSIDTLVRHPRVVEAAPDPKTIPAKPGEAAVKHLPFDSFTLGITASQNAFISAFDKIPANPGFLVVRTMTIENSSPNAPLKADIGKAVHGAPASPAPPGTADKLPTVFGTELVKATLVFEILDFPEKKPEEKAAHASTPPTPKK